MNLLKENIIQKQVIDIIVNAPVDGFEFQNEAESLCRVELQKGMDKLLEKYNFLEEVVRIDVLFAEVNYSSLNDFGDSFAEKILREVEKVLLQKISDLSGSDNDAIISIPDRLVQLLIYYLQKGFLPWWSSVKTTGQWQEQLEELLFHENKNADWTLFYPVLKERSVRIRMSEILNQNQFWRLIENISPVSITSLRVDYEIIPASFSPEQRQVFQAVYKDVLLDSIAHLSDSNLVIESFSDRFVKYIKSEYPQLFSEVVPDKIITTALKTFFITGIISSRTNMTLKSDTDHIIADEASAEGSRIKKDSERQYAKVEKEEIYINNAGLVIPAAYLPMFFKDLGLVSDDGVLNTDKAIAVMQYMVKGTEEYEELECVLLKILCGMELNDPLVKKKLSNKEKHKVNDLLESIVEHWAVLKNTSTDGLRVSFLQRGGRLVFKNREWHLTVQQEAYDMLLSHLPWNISMIKLPYMTCLLHVDWT